MGRVSYDTVKGDDGWFERYDKYIVAYTYHVVGRCGWSEQNEDEFDTMPEAINYANKLKPNRSQDVISDIEVWHVANKLTKAYVGDRRK